MYYCRELPISIFARGSISHDKTGMRRQRRSPMYMLRLALFAVLRIAVFGAVKLALYAYVLTLPDTALAGAASKRDGRTGGTASHAPQAHNVQADVVPPLR